MFPIIDQKYMTVVVMLVLVSSVLAPILLKLLFKNDKDDSCNGEIIEEDKSTNNEENNADNTLVLTTSEETANKRKPLASLEPLSEKSIALIDISPWMVQPSKKKCQLSIRTQKLGAWRHLGWRYSSHQDGDES